jgi:hypothetical protein
MFLSLVASHRQRGIHCKDAIAKSLYIPQTKGENIWSIPVKRKGAERGQLADCLVPFLVLLLLLHFCTFLFT